jgi:two-component system, cell cycle response regulator
MGTNKSKSSAPPSVNMIILGYRVLVVDDYQPFQEMLAASLGSLKAIEEIDFADSGISAIEKAEAKQYDLIFLDVMMPLGIDGYEACTRLRDNPVYKKTPIIMVSGMDSPFDEVKGIISGCTTYVTKPIQNKPFLKLCNRVLNWLEFQKNINAD